MITESGFTARRNKRDRIPVYGNERNFRIGIPGINWGCNFSKKLRVGNVGTGTNDFTTITAPYNEPRSSSSNPSGERAHKGTDFRSIDRSGNGRKLFFVYDNGEVYQIESSLNSSG